MDDLVDPHEGKTYKLRAVFGEEVEEVEMSAAQVLDLGAGRAVAFTVRDDVRGGGGRDDRAARVGDSRLPRRGLMATRIVFDKDFTADS